MAPPLQFAVTRLIDAPDDAVWRVLGDFGSEHRWTKTLSYCSRDTVEVRVGTVRTCRLPRPLMGRTEVRETVTVYEPGCALSYSLAGAAGPFASAAGRWSINPTSSRTTAVTVEGSFQPKNRAVRFVVWPLARPMLRRLTKRVLGELETYVIHNG